MLKYTVAASKKIVEDLKLLAHVITIIMQSFMICYLAVAILLNNGSRAINSVLCALTAVNFIVYLVTYPMAGRRARSIKGAVSRGYTYVKLSLNAISLASVIYSIYVSASEVTGLTLVIAPIMILLWVAQVLFQLARAYAENRLQLFTDALKMDFDFVISPIHNAKNLVHDFLGEEREERREISEKNRRVLEERAEIEEERKQDRRAAVMGKLAGAIRARFSGVGNGSPNDSDDEQ